MTRASPKAPNLSVLTEKQRDNALAKFRIIQPYIEDKSTLTQICSNQRLSIKTVSNWVSRYRKHGLAGLARKARSDQGSPRICSAQTKALIEGIHLKNRHLSRASIYREVKKHTESLELPTPSYRTICSIIKSIPKDMVTLAHGGRKDYKQQFDLLYIRECQKPNEIWQADHALLDIVIQHGSKKKGARPWLTIVFDDYSRAIAGYELSFSAPSARKTALAFRQGIWHKKEPAWTVCGIPEAFYTDHGSDFTSKHIEQVCADLKIQLIFSAVGEPRGRGKIERFFRTLNQTLLSELPGYIRAKSATPQMPLSDLKQHIHDFILQYNQRRHSSTKQPPKARWEANGFLPQMPESLEKLDLLLLTVAKSRIIRRDGIHFEGLRYLDPILADYVGSSVIIRYDPSDLTSIRVFHQNEYLCQPICHALNHQEVSLKDIQAARNSRKKAVHTEIQNRLSLVDAILQKSTTKPTPVQNAPKPAKKKRKLKLYDND